MFTMQTSVCLVATMFMSHASWSFYVKSTKFKGKIFMITSHSENSFPVMQNTTLN